MNYKTHTLSNGLRLIYLPLYSDVTYCGMVINTGSRDEQKDEEGMAHFIEHGLFKGTKKRRATHIINRLEVVGGELNAYTSKEETVVYAVVLNPYLERATELIGDLVFHSVFPQKELDKEKEVIIDEISSYNDSPSELIYDDFEELLFQSHSLGHNILGKIDTLSNFHHNNVLDFVKRHYQPAQMVFFVVGETRFDMLVRWAEKYFIPEFLNFDGIQRIAPATYQPSKKVVDKNTHQAHVIIGNRAYDMNHASRLGLYLLNNIVGGPGMNSLLNLNLREKRGLVYTVESTFQPFTDTGLWTVYFGCDIADVNKIEKLIDSELMKLQDKPFTEAELQKYKMQLTGQMAISWDNKENLAMGVGKSFLRYGKVDELDFIKKELESIQPADIQRIAQDIFRKDQLSTLQYIKA